jgi:hypothetical protein
VTLLDRVNVRLWHHRPFREWLDKAYPRLTETIQVTRWAIKDRYYHWRQGNTFDRLHELANKPSHIEIETVNRCNGTCQFCPINRDEDPRDLARMPEPLFKKIIDDLKDWDYRGTLNLFSNNEPFVDKRILDFLAYARAQLPNTFILIISNGTLLNVAKAEKALEMLSSMVINDYNVEHKLSANVIEIIDHLNSKRPDLAKKLNVTVRSPLEVKTNRGGNAPNREDLPQVFHSRCAYPFFQMVIRPDGKISLCCNDALGEVTLGDIVATNSLRAAWDSPERRDVQRAMLAGRDGISLCAGCDNLGWARPKRIANALETGVFTSW